MSHALRSFILQRCDHESAPNNLATRRRPAHYARLHHLTLCIEPLRYSGTRTPPAASFTGSRPRARHLRRAAADARAAMPFLDAYTSVVALLSVGALGGVLGSVTRVPRVVCMILLGIALMPSVHPSVLDATSYTYGPSANVNGVMYGPAGSYAVQNPASSMRTMALLVALMRGGLSIKLPVLTALGPAIAILAVVPYFFELFAEAAVAPALLPSWFGDGVPEGAPPPLVAYTAASVWAALSPSIVIPNMLHFVESGLTEAGKLVLTGAPLEVSTALLTEGVMAKVLTVTAAGGDTRPVLGHVVTFVLGSALYGVAFALGFYGYVRARRHEAVVRHLQPAAPVELQLVFVAIFILCYTTSIDDVNTPWLVGFFAAVCMAVATQFLLPDLADEICASLKPAWAYAECLLFTLTGCVIRPAIDAGLSSDLFGAFLGVLIVGTLARMAGDVLACVAWAYLVRRTPPWRWDGPAWADLARRVAFVWMATLPKATLQGSLGPKLKTVFKTARYLAPAAFIAPSSAIAILYAASVGSLLTYTIGWSIASHLQAHHDGEAPKEGATARAVGGGRTGTASSGNLMLLMSSPTTTPRAASDGELDVAATPPARGAKK